MSSIYLPRWHRGDRVLHNGQPATVLCNGKDEGSVVFQFDHRPHDEYFTHEANLVSLTDRQSND